MAKIKKYQIGGYVVNQYGDTLRGKAAMAERARQRQYEQSVIKENPASKIKSEKPASKPAAKSSTKLTDKPFKKVLKSGGKVVKKAKSGKSFPDLTGDGKITRADILKGRGVIRKGGKISKARMGCASCGKSMKKKK